MTDDQTIAYLKDHHFDPYGKGLHQLTSAESEFQICLNFMLDNHPEWRSCNENDIMSYVMRRFNGTANPNSIRKWINHIQDRLNK